MRAIQMYQTSDRQIFRTHEEAFKVEYKIFSEEASKFLTEKGVLRYNDHNKIIRIMYISRNLIKSELDNRFQDEMEENLNKILFSKIHEDDRIVLGNVMYKYKKELIRLLRLIDE